MGLRYLGGFETAVYNPLASNITSGTSTVQTQGVFTLKQQAQALANQQWVTDPNFKQTALLLQADNAANGAQNNTFLDSSDNNFTSGITRNGTPTQGTFSPFSQPSGFWSIFTSAASATSGISSSNTLVDSTVSTFTAEAWIYMTDAPVSGDGVPALIGLNATFSSSIFLSFGPNASRRLVLRWFDGASKTATGGTTLALNTWYHIAVVANSNAIAIYLNGVAEALTGTTTLTNRSSSASAFSLFLNTSASNYQFRGYASNIRVCTSAVYTSGFTPSTAPLTTTSQGATGCVLLTAQSNRFVDNSSNVLALTTQGTPSVQPFAPFAPRFQWTPAIVGGSGYFVPASTSYLTVANAAALQFDQSSFIISCWVYRSVAGVIQTIASKGTTSTGWVFQITAANVLQFITGTSTNVLTGSRTIPVNAWTYVSLTREVSGTTAVRFRLYVNGIQDNGSFPGTTAVNYNQINVLNIGANRTTPPTTNFFNGYMAGFEYVKGQSRSDNDFTPPTAPPVKETNNPSLLLNFTNAGIYDAAMDNVLETVGSAQVSTSIVKYGSGSMSFDGSGDYLFIPSTTTARFGSANWTIEFWFRTTLPTTRQIMVGWNAVVGAFAACNINFLANGKIGLQISETGSAWKYDDNSTGVGTALSANTWYHLAVTRNEQIVTVYVNGSAFGTYVLTAATTSLMGTTADTRNVVGISPDLTNQPFNGYIDDLRVTNGVARYYQNFIPPLVALPRQ
jgi:hypothetical protein